MALILTLENPLTTSGIGDLTERTVKKSHEALREDVFFYHKCSLVSSFLNNSAKVRFMFLSRGIFPTIESSKVMTAERQGFRLVSHS